MPRLAPVLFQQLHVGDGHAPVHGFAHVIDGQQDDLNGGERFIQINNLQHLPFHRLA